MRRSVLIAVAVAVAAACLPARVASAGTLSYQERDCGEGSHSCATTTLYRAEPGESNDVTFSRDATGATVHDAVAGVRAGAFCVAIDAHTARCPAYDLDLALGDGDDRAGPGAGVRYTGRVVTDGGAGKDVLAGGEGSDWLKGGDGADTIAGGVGDDTLDGGAGADVVDGGDGTDLTSYFGGPPVSVDLTDAGADGPPTEPDWLRSIEQVVGSAGADTLRGDGAANLLQGGPGDDVISGEGGNDVLYGGTGFDRLTGGAGDDELAPDSGGTDDPAPGPRRGEREPGGEGVSCGDGTDLVSEQAHDVLKDCERLELPLGFLAPSFDPRVALDGRAAVLQLRCSTRLRAGTGPGCRVRVTLSAERHRFGVGTFRFTGTRTVRLPLPLRRGAALSALRVELRYQSRAAAKPDQAAIVYVERFG